MTDCFVLDKVMMMSWDMLKQRVTSIEVAFLFPLSFKEMGKQCYSIPCSNCTNQEYQHKKERLSRSVLVNFVVNGRDFDWRFWKRKTPPYR
jgi:hypothetical protein